MYGFLLQMTKRLTRMAVYGRCQQRATTLFTRLAQAPIVLRCTDDICQSHTPRVIVIWTRRYFCGYAPVDWKAWSCGDLDRLFRYAEVGRIYCGANFVSVLQ